MARLDGTWIRDQISVLNRKSVFTVMKLNQWCPRVRKYLFPIAFRNYFMPRVTQYSCEIEQRNHHSSEKNDLIMNLAHLCCQLAKIS